jgi:hypothetical protein
VKKVKQPDDPKRLLWGRGKNRSKHHFDQDNISPFDALSRSPVAP